MTTYKGLRGMTIQTVDGDPGTIQLGELWYNSSSRALRVGQTSAAAWATGTSLPTAIHGHGGAGTTTAALSFAGTPAITESFEWDGSSWGAEVNVNTGRGYTSGFGTQTAAILCPGLDDLNATEEYNGSAWTNGGDTNEDRRTMAAMGTQTAGLIAGGLYNPGPNAVAATAEEYDGSSWTEVGDLTTARTSNSGFGTQTAGISVAGMTGGSASDRVAVVEEYNGTSWTEVTDVGAANYSAMSWGTQTAGMYAGGYGYNNTSFTYDGTNWAASANLNLGRNRGAASTAGTTTSALLFGGAIQPSDNQVAVEEFTGPTTAAATVTSS